MPEINITVDERPAPDVVEVIAGMPGPVGPTGPTGPPVLRGAWSPVETYYPEDLVTRGGSTWLAAAVSTGVDPAADPSTQVVGSMTYPSPLALGSPTSVASGFTVDRDTFAVALTVAQSWAGATNGVGTVGIADAINVPGIGISWVGKGSVGALGRVELDQMATLSAGVRYWLVMIMPTASIQIDQGPEIVGSHMTWSGEFWYGSTEPSNNFGLYGLAVALYGTTADNAWQLFVARGKPGPTGPTGPPAAWVELTRAAYTALTPKDPAVLYVVIG